MSVFFYDNCDGDCSHHSSNYVWFVPFYIISLFLIATDFSCLLICNIPFKNLYGGLYATELRQLLFYSDLLKITLFIDDG